jgi:hypothetical protein
VEAELAPFSSRAHIAGPDLMVDAKMVRGFTSKNNAFQRDGCESA